MDPYAYKICIDFTPFVQAFQKWSVALNNFSVKYRISTGYAPILGPGIDI